MKNDTHSFLYLATKSRNWNSEEKRSIKGREQEKKRGNKTGILFIDHKIVSKYKIYNQWNSVSVVSFRKKIKYNSFLLIVYLMPRTQLKLILM